MTDRLTDVMRIYAGSDGQATQALYAELEALGPAGIVAAFLMRAQKNSARAKVYRGGPASRRGVSWRQVAYDRKQWALDRLAEVLATHADTVGLEWGWGNDPTQAFHCVVLYVELPGGQVSFHTARRGVGPDHPRPWDGVRNASAQRVCAYAARVLDAARAASLASA